MLMLLALDIGNSAMKAGLFTKGGSLERTGRIELAGLADPAGPADPATPHERASLLIDRLKEFLNGKVSSGAKLTGAALASVVPGATAEVAEAVETLLTGHPPLVLTHETDSGLVLDIAEPSTLGADRIAGALGAVHAIGAPVAVVDLGTATTVGFVVEGDTPESAVFRGGAILPGLALMGRALSGGTAQLPEVDLGMSFNALGRDTQENILSGIVLGTAGAVERIVAEVERSEGVGFQVVLTGGLAKVAASHMSRKPALVEPNLTLLGLKAVYERVHAS